MCTYFLMFLEGEREKIDFFLLVFIFYFQFFHCEIQWKRIWLLNKCFKQHNKTRKLKAVQFRRNRILMKEILWELVKNSVANEKGSLTPGNICLPLPVHHNVSWTGQLSLLSDRKLTQNKGVQVVTWIGLVGRKGSTGDSGMRLTFRLSEWFKTKALVYISLLAYQKLFSINPV